VKDLQTLPERTAIVTLEWAGNGRTRMNPVPPGTPWAYGAVGTARFTGTPLHLLLDQAGVGAEAIEVVFTGADQGEVEPGRVTRFARSLPLDVARHPDILLAWAMNGEPLPLQHGFPLRLIVPRWYGVASVKWLVGITVLSRPFEGYFQRESYVYVGERGTPEGTPVTLVRVRGVIGRPSDESKLPLGPVEVAGTAWAGTGPISRVEVSADDGRSWAEAALGTVPSPYAATPWRFVWVPPGPGTYTLMARATDSAGNTQPVEPVWNVYGYGGNVVHRIRVTVR
jgi:DMSO/TMAO reductase YedYZ molybdopterin-dependent catalytic subunit